jgi:hypothetical protein
MLSSFLRRTVRWKLMPQVSLFGSKLSVRKGISISIVQPISLWRHAGVPDAVPRAVHAVDAEHGVGHEARRVHLEEITGAFIEEGIDAPHETIVGRQELVAAALIAQPLVRFGVVRSDAHVEGVLADDDAHLGGLGGRRAVLRVDLDEVLGRLGLLPDAFVEPSVEHDALAIGQPHRLDLTRGTPPIRSWPSTTGSWAPARPAG